MRNILPVSPTQMVMNAWRVVVGRLVLIFTCYEIQTRISAILKALHDFPQLL
jgi:hypothetical protein